MRADGGGVCGFRSETAPHHEPPNRDSILERPKDLRADIQDTEDISHVLSPSALY